MGQVHELADIGDTLMYEAREWFESGDQLFCYHIAALAKFRLISDAEVRDWEEAKGQKSGE